jgi:hypothetical protein
MRCGSEYARYRTWLDVSAAKRAVMDPEGGRFAAGLEPRYMLEALHVCVDLAMRSPETKDEKGKRREQLEAHPRIDYLLQVISLYRSHHLGFMKL